MEIINLDNTHSVGLGDNLCLISLLASISEPVELRVDHRHDTYERLCRYKKIFMISDDKLRIVRSDVNGDFKNTGWPLKINRDYYRPPAVEVNGSVLNTSNEKHKEKRCIALAAFYDTPPEDNKNEWPWCKRRGLEYWAKMFVYFKSLHYDVITVDRHMFDLENKIETIIKNCKAIVGYEGGMSHLAHMLNVPLLLVDWTYPAPSTNLDRFHCEFVHQSKSMYILRDDEELFSWTDNQLESVLHGLRQGRTNNRLINGECRFDFQGPGLFGPLTVRDKQNRVLLKTSGLFDRQDVAANFVNNYFSAGVIQG
jgi:hypothetical protein